MESKEKFTPGPWRHTVQFKHGVCDNKLNVIAYCDCLGTKYKEEQANCNLIAAAPEMYEMLEKVADALAFWRNEGEVYVEMQRGIRAILAKARGEEVDDGE